MMQFAAGSISQGMNTRLQSAIPIFGGYWTDLKAYFEVDNRYVLAKMKTVLFPVFLKGKKWKRLETEDGEEDSSPPAPPQQLHPSPQASPSFSKKYSPPSVDANAPDLYLPLMSFVTYVVLTSYVKGTNGQFTPEVLSQVTYSCLAWQLLEVLVIRLGLYMLSVQAAPLLDLVANTGYIYVGLCVNMLVGVLLGKTAYAASVCWTGGMASFFMLKTLSNNYARGGGGGDEQSKALRMPLLWSFAVLQFVSIWWLGYGSDIHAAGGSALAASAAAAATAAATKMPSATAGT